MRVRFYLDFETQLPHIYKHGVKSTRQRKSLMLLLKTDRATMEHELQLVKRQRGVTCE